MGTFIPKETTGSPAETGRVPVSGKDQDGNAAPLELHHGSLRAALSDRSNRHASIGVFGTLLANPETTQIESAFHPWVPGRVWFREMEGAGADIRVEGGGMVLETGLTDHEEAEVRSVIKGEYHPGTGMRLTWSWILGDTGFAGNVRAVLFGAHEGFDGIGLRLNGTALEYVRVNDGVEAVVASSAWKPNGVDVVALAVDTLNHVWSLEWQYFGVGDVFVYRDDELVHTEKNLGSSVGIAWMGANQQVILENENTAVQAAKRKMTFGSLRLFSQGKFDRSVGDPTHFAVSSTAGVAAPDLTPVDILAMAARKERNGFFSHRAIEVRQISVLATKSAGIVEIIKNVQITGTAMNVEAPVDPATAWSGMASPFTATLIGHAHVSGEAHGQLFEVGEVITGGTSGATGTIFFVPRPGRYSVTGIVGTFTPGEIITGGTTGFTGTLDLMEFGIHGGYVDTDSLTYKVAAIGSTGETLPSAASAAVVITAAVDDVCLLWEPVTHAIGYNVYRSVNAGPYEWVGLRPGDETFYIDHADVSDATRTPAASNTTDGDSYVQYYDSPTVVGGTVVRAFGAPKAEISPLILHPGELKLLTGETLSFRYTAGEAKADNEIFIDVAYREVFG